MNVYVLQFDDDCYVDFEGVFSTMEKAKEALIDYLEGIDIEISNFQCHIDDEGIAEYSFFDETHERRVVCLISEFKLDKTLYN